MEDTKNCASVIDEIVTRAATAAAVFNELNQRQTDAITRAVYMAAFDARVRLAKMAVEESGIGRWEDKVIKNVVASQLVYEQIRDLPTVGVVSRDVRLGITEIAQPLGPIVAIIPCTNPTSTVIFKILIALKTRNPIIIRPHPRTVNCSIEAARVCYEAALEAGAPDDCVQWRGDHSLEETSALMANRKVALVLATGGGALVHAAYSSGTPAIGVGSGNVPVLIERTADLAFTVDQILASKLFDNGTVCASEQALVVEKAVAEPFAAELRGKGGYFLNARETEQVGSFVFDAQKRVMNAACVGKSAEYVAQQAGINIPAGTRLLIAPLSEVSSNQPLSSEVLCPVIAYYVEPDFKNAIKRCIDLNYHGGVGHTASIFSNNEERIREFSMLLNAGRILVNMPSSQGGVGGIYNTLPTSFTLGCGSGGHNITTDNITAHHLLNIQRVTSHA
ncbi:MAG: aldehyde dehydrogenase family protein [Candidatus Sumerlaeota bacterium]|nr:aldehyde dehydrogenase family protein [Candidatus Sumerlaeota bacterium]